MIRHCVFTFLCAVMMTGCGTTLVVGPTISTNGQGTGVMVSVEQPFWALGSDDGRIGLVTKASAYGGWSAHQGSNAGGGAGVAYVVTFKESYDPRRGEDLGPPLNESYDPRREEDLELPYDKQPLDMVKAKSKTHGAVYFGLSGGYLYSNNFGGDLMLVAPEFGMTFNAGSWRDMYVDVGGKLQCFLSAQSQACGPALTMTLRPKIF
jgi:hypothetical protein